MPTLTAVQMTCGIIKEKDAQKYILNNFPEYPNHNGVMTLSSIVNPTVQTQAITVKIGTRFAFNAMRLPKKPNSKASKLK